jgi:[ribosomal protein S5]-alanine N-acetyltransferase
MLTGKKVILRPLKMEDIIKTHEWRNNIDLLRLTQGVRFPKTMEMDKEWFEITLKDKSNRNIYFGIDSISNKEFVGIIHLNNIDYISGTSNWGFIIGDLVNRGKGYSIEAPKLLFDYAFNILNLRKITGYRMSYNKEAFFMHQLIGGFVEEGRLKSQVYFDGKYHDVIILSLFRECYLNINNK